MKIQRKILLFTLLLSLGNSLWAQSEITDSNSTFQNRLNKEFFIDYELPKKFIMANPDYQCWSIKEYPKLAKIIAGCQSNVIQSTDSMCIMLWTSPIYINNRDSINHAMVGFTGGNNLQHLYNIRANISKIKKKKILLKELNRYIEYWSQEKAKSWFNADTVIVYSLPVPQDEPFRGKYKYSTVLTIQKNNRGFLHIYIFYTDAGYRNEEEYIVELYKKIWFRDN